MSLEISSKLEDLLKIGLPAPESYEHPLLVFLREATENINTLTKNSENNRKNLETLKAVLMSLGVDVENEYDWAGREW